jgi:hypothetical protein
MKHYEGVFVVFVTQYAQRMRRIMLLSAASPTAVYFSTLSHKGTTFGKKKCIEYKTCFNCPYKFCFKHFRKNSVRHYHKFTEIFMKIILYSCRILMKLKFSQHISKKHLSIQFNENFSSESRVVPYGRTGRDGQTWESQCSLFAVLRTRLKIDIRASSEKRDP